MTSQQHSQQHLAALLQRFLTQAQLVRSWPLTGGVSAVVSALEIAGGQPRKLVVRQYGERDLKRNPASAEDEFRLLDNLYAASLPVPRPLYHEPGVLITEWIEGQNGVDTAVNPQQMAGFLARLHALKVPVPPLHPLAEVRPAPKNPDEAWSESRIRAALAGFRPEPQQPVLLHGDFWPGNTLWQTGQLAAVIDWEDAALGHPLYDVGNTRLELLFFYGPAAMNAFSDEYSRLTRKDLTGLAYWDLRAALRPCGQWQTWGLVPDQAQQMHKRHAWFVEQAIARP